MRREFKLKRPSYSNSFDIIGDLTCDAFELCSEHLLLYFDVLSTDRVMYVVLSTEEHPQSYGVRRYGVRREWSDHLEVEGQKDSQWVDKDLVDEVVAFAKAAGRVGEYVYLSLEFPNKGEE